MRAATVLTLVICAGCAARPADRSSIVPRLLVIDPAATTIPHAPGDELTVATYNVHGLRDRDGVRRDLASMDDVDVWCFQEFPPSARLEEIVTLGRWHAAIAEVNPGEAQVIASRLPLTDVGVWPLDDRGAKRRAALVARASVSGRSVLVVNTDHEPSFFALRDGNTFQTRRLAERLRAGGPEPTVVGGDFNCAGSLWRFRGNDAHVARVDSTLNEVGFVAPAAREATYRWGLIRSRVDRVYARGLVPLDEGVASDARGSDHRPAWRRFALRNEISATRPAQ